MRPNGSITTPPHTHSPHAHTGRDYKTYTQRSEGRKGGDAIVADIGVMVLLCYVV